MSDDPENLTNTCHGCGKDFGPHPREGVVAWMRRKYCGRECAQDTRHRGPIRLPEPTTERRAVVFENPPCAGMPDLMYTEQPFGPEVQQAKRICGGCDYRTECLQRALENREPYGIWGGYTAKERDNYLRRAKRQGSRAA